MRTTDTQARAGHYLIQPSGNKAFIPSALPPEPPIQIDGEIQEHLSKADRALGRLDGSIQTLPHPNLFVAMYVRKEAVISSQIEGTQSSLQDLLAAEAHIFSAERPGDVNEVINYVKAMNYGLNRLSELPVSVRLIREIHAILMQGVRGRQRNPGELRSIQNWIGPSNCTPQEAIFVPPPPQEISRLMSELEHFLHQESTLPLLVRIGLAHAQFETIHPFLDGNGRIGRLLITLLLCEKDVLTKPVLYLSHYFKRYRQQYYDSLQAVRDNGDWEQWINFFLQGVYEVSQESTETARQILQLRERHRQLITEELGRSANNGHRVLEHLYKMPIVSVPQIRDLLGITYPAANNLVSQFQKLGLLYEMTAQKRNRRFEYRDYMLLFSETNVNNKAME